jgi:hypothetical protein
MLFMCFGQPGRDELEAAGAEVAKLPGSCIRVGDFGSSEGANSCKQLDCFVVSARHTQVVTSLASLSLSLSLPLSLHACVSQFLYGGGGGV